MLSAGHLSIVSVISDIMCQAYLTFLEFVQMPEAARSCQHCNNRAEYVCLYCPQMSFYCADHQCAHLVTGSPHPLEAMKEMRTASKSLGNQPGQTSKTAIGVLAAIGVFVLVSWAFDTGDSTLFVLRIFALFGIFLFICALAAGKKSKG